MRIGSLFAGYGGLDLAAADVLDGTPAWFAEIEPAPSRILAHHWPGVPNFGDVTTVDWAAVARYAPVDVLTGGFPCQDVSLAGLRRGLHPDTRSGLWSHFAAAIDALRPPLVIIENVRGLLSAEAHSDLEPDAWDLGDRSVRPPLRALGAVLGDLAELGYDARWAGIRAADAGAPHGRFRVFVIARPARDTTERGRIQSPARAAGTATLPARGSDRPLEDTDLAARREWRIAAPGHPESGRPRADARGRDRAPDPVPVEWGDYEPAIRRWEHVTGREAPTPTDPSRTGDARLSARFVEWMMGLPAGHVTAPEIGLTRREQLTALGNGVVPQQAALALRTLLATEPS